MTISLRAEVSIGPLLPEYAPAMYRWMCDPVVSENLGLVGEPSIGKTALWIEKASSDPSMRAFAILVEGRHVGNVVIDRIDPYIEEGRLSVYVGDDRGRGFGLTGMYLAIRETFRDLDLHKIYLTVHIRNVCAISAYSRLGFIPEGILRDAFLLRGERLAALYMGLLRTEFESLETK